MVQPVEGRVEGALLDGEGAARELLDAQQDPVAVDVAQGDGLEDEEVEGAGEDVGLGFDWSFSYLG